MNPQEIVAAPFEVWVAPYGTAFPDPDDAPSASWRRLGSNGNKNHSEDGVTVSHTQTLEYIRVSGTTGPVKAIRTEEDLKIMLTLLDLSVEQFTYAINGIVAEDTAPGSGTAGVRSVNLRRGFTVTELAVVVRGPSPYDETFFMQWQIPRVVISANPEVALRKGEPAGVDIEFTALEDPNASSDNTRFGKVVAQDAAAT